MNMLVVGGTRFFGIPMVEALLQRGHQVTIGTRGNAALDFSKPVEHVTFDRWDARSVQRALEGKHFDMIIDKIAYSSNDVTALLSYVSCEKYILMSSCAVYPEDHLQIREEEFNGCTYPLHWIDRIEDYQESKRQAERAVYEYLKPQQFAMVRYPIVLGEHDYTGRLRFYVEHVAAEQPMYVDDLDMGMAFIHEKEAGEFIAHLVDHFVSGPVNGCAYGTVKIGDIIRKAEELTGKKAVLTPDGDVAPFNGLTTTTDYDVSKAEALGFEFSHLEDWIFGLMY